ncbi:unnamed protein product [Meloidogyne enterolobii]|uniref:Uncharacterized protein n=1 Tax=Meloidogyne enterolobii TaxID=390850 RepID=A0ACB1AIA6_MELEN
MPSKDKVNRRKRRQRHLAESEFDSNATNSCGVEGVSNDGFLFNVNSTRGSITGDGNSMDCLSMVDGGVELALESGVVCEVSEVGSEVGDCEMREVGRRLVSCEISQFGSQIESNIINDNFYNDFESESDSFSVFSLNSSKNSVLSYERSKGGRPKKMKRSSGRPKKNCVKKNSFVNEFNSINIVNTPSNDNLNMNYVPEFLSIDLLDIPFGPMPNIENRIFTDDIVFSRPEIINLWSDPNEWLQDSFVFIYLKFLSYRSNLNVVVVSPQFVVVEHHFGQGVEPLNIFDYCFNYNQDYDILLIPIIFPGHFGLVIFDRSDRDNFSCVFVDSLPSVNRLTDVSCGVFDHRRVDLIKRCICDLTPGLFVENINIQVLSRSMFTEQRDGINCGFYACLYSEGNVFYGTFRN